MTWREKETKGWEQNFTHRYPAGAVEKNPPSKQETHEIWVPFLGREDASGIGKATFSSILARNIPWTEEPGLYTMGSQKVGLD